MPAAHPANEAAVREQAYLLWEQEGRPSGREMEFWARAEVVVAEKAQMDQLVEAPPKRVNAGAVPKLKSAASKMKAVPAKGKAAEKSKPKKK